LTVRIDYLACREDALDVTLPPQPMAAKIKLDELPVFLEEYQRVTQVQLVGDIRPETYIVQVRSKLVARSECKETWAKTAERRLRRGVTGKGIVTKSVSVKRKIGI
jgi:hypothetical protein